MLTKILVIVAIAVATVVAMFVLGRLADGKGDAARQQDEP